MTCNVGGIERPIRILLGILMLGTGALANLSLVGTGVALMLGTTALVTGVIEYCPLWTLLGVNTCPRSSAEKLERMSRR
jgi:hypothetical protein